MIRLQLITGLRNSEFKLNLLEALRAKDNLIVDEMLKLIQYRTQPQRSAESSIHQSISCVVACSGKRGPNIRNVCVAVRNQNRVDDLDERHSIHSLSALLRMKGLTIVRSKNTTPEFAKLKNKNLRDIGGNLNDSQMHQCTMLVRTSFRRFLLIRRNQVLCRTNCDCRRSPSTVNFISTKISFTLSTNLR